MRGGIVVLTLVGAAMIAAVIATAGIVSGDRRSLVFSLAVPGLAALVAAALGLIAGAGLVITRRRGRLVALVQRESRDAAAAEHRRFLARLDHELKNPVTAIRVAVAASDADTPQLGSIDAQTARLSRLVGDLRKLSELQTSDIERVPVSVSAWVADVVDAVRDAHGREASVALPAAPWPLPDVIGDPDLLFVALFNVVSNAMKYSEPGDVVEIRGDEQGGVVILDIADTGRGIPSAELVSVFDELARASNARDRPGSGLGLALVRTIVDRHGGEVTITSREGHGTRVRLRVPAAG